MTSGLVSSTIFFTSFGSMKVSKRYNDDQVNTPSALPTGTMSYLSPRSAVTLPIRALARSGALLTVTSLYVAGIVVYEEWIDEQQEGSQLIYLYLDTTKLRHVGQCCPDLLSLSSPLVDASALTPYGECSMPIVKCNGSRARVLELHGGPALK